LTTGDTGSHGEKAEDPLLPLGGEGWDEGAKRRCLRCSKLTAESRNSPGAENTEKNPSTKKQNQVDSCRRKSSRNNLTEEDPKRYRQMVGREVGDLGEVIRARKPERLPVVMTCEEVNAVLANLSGDKRITTSLMYGTGLRLMECLLLTRIKRRDKGEHDRNPLR